MPALTSVKDFVAGAVLTAANMDEVNCGVKVFANAAARDAAYGGAGERTLEEGEMCYLNDTNAVMVYNGSSWVNAGGVGNAVVSTAAGSYQGTVHEGGTVFDVWTYNASGSLVVTTAGLVDMLLVGGGGSGGLWGALGQGDGGGGAGAHLTVERGYLPAGTLTVTVGAGGAAPVTSGEGNNGRVSRVGSYFAPGGGGGGTGDTPTGGGNGASGGGGGSASDAAGTGESGLGNNGGTGGTSAGGGGGGAGAVGSNATATVGGAGGNGSANSYTGTSVTRAGGGGGASTSGGGTGGTGGGGNGGSSAGGANTGGGGGGGQTTGFSGGSGVVIVRAAR